MANKLTKVEDDEITIVNAYINMLRATKKRDLKLTVETQSNYQVAYKEYFNDVK